MKVSYLGIALLLTAGNGWAQEFSELQNTSFPEMLSSAQNKADIMPAAAVLVSTERLPRTVDNPDGSTSIVGPLYKSMPISYHTSDHGSVCRLFGFNGHVAQTMKKLRRPKRLSTISIDGNFLAAQYAFEVYDVIVCTNGGLATLSTQYEKISDIGGGLTRIHAPRFDYDGTPTPISIAGSSNIGVCRLFGFKAYAASASTLVWPGTYPAINSRAKLSELGRSFAVYNTIDCR